MNELLKAANEQEKVSWRTILATEPKYSRLRLNSLHEEWEVMYPALPVTMCILEGLR